MSRPGLYPVLTAKVDSAAIGDALVVAAPAANQRIVVTGFTLVTNGAVGIRLKSGSNDKSGLMKPGASAVIDSNGSPESPVIACNAGEALNVNLDAAVQTGGPVTYIVESV